MRQIKRLLFACLAGGAVYMLPMSGCLIDDDRCDANQVYKSEVAHECVCAPGYVFSERGYGCEACGDHEEVVGGKCVCEDGYVRAGDSAPCKMIDGTPAGSECNGPDDCADPNPYCAESEDEPYCTTQGCDRSDECNVDWRCASTGGQSFCSKPPSGFGKTCQTSADCTDPEAAYCEAFMTHTCIINDCLKAPGKCLSGSVCCDLSAVVGESLCIPVDRLTDGKCYGGADPVTP